MAFDIKTTLGQIAGWLQSTGYVDSVTIGEPKAPPQAKISAALFMSSVKVVGLYLNGGTKELHSVTLRLYMNMLGDVENTEYDMAKAVSQVSSSLLGDFDMGTTIRNLDAGGEHGQALSATWGYIDVGRTMYRTVDITLPLVVDDSATAAA